MVSSVASTTATERCFRSSNAVVPSPPSREIELKSAVAAACYPPFSCSAVSKMPLVRFEVRNEYGLGDPELYRAEAKKEDPRAVLDGVAVAGLVGILRQLGDLAELVSPCPRIVKFELIGLLF